MASVVISPDAAAYIGEKEAKNPNVIIYRGIEGVACHCAARFVSKVKVTDGKEPDEMFFLLGRSDGVKVWAEKALEGEISKGNSVVISLKKGLLAKSLQVELGSKLLGKV